MSHWFETVDSCDLEALARPLMWRSVVTKEKLRRAGELQTSSSRGSSTLTRESLISHDSKHGSHMDPFIVPEKKKWKSGWVRSRSQIVSGPSGRLYWHQIKFFLHARSFTQLVSRNNSSDFRYSPPG